MKQPTTCVDAEPYVLRVLDDSMEPEFERGCVIVIDPTGVAESGAYVLAEYRDEPIFRQLELAQDRYNLKPLNDSYPTLALEDGLGAIRGVIVQRAGIRRSYHKRY